MRLDKWLWFARYFKTRSLATAAVTGGRVHVNGVRVKPAHDVQVGDAVFITRDAVQFEVVVQALLTRRGPAAEAQAAYVETEQSIALRARQREQLRNAPPAPQGRPDKHDRRALRGLRDRQY
jgi:ribosome-associated heat shock protein Hsp15